MAGAARQPAAARLAACGQHGHVAPTARRWEVSRPVRHWAAPSNETTTGAPVTRSGKAPAKPPAGSGDVGTNVGSAKGLGNAGTRSGSDSVGGSSSNNSPSSSSSNTTTSSSSGGPPPTPVRSGASPALPGSTSFRAAVKGAWLAFSMDPVRKLLQTLALYAVRIGLFVFVFTPCVCAYTWLTGTYILDMDATDWLPGHGAEALAAVAAAAAAAAATAAGVVVVTEQHTAGGVKAAEEETTTGHIAETEASIRMCQNGSAPPAYIASFEMLLAAVNAISRNGLYRATWQRNDSVLLYGAPVR